MPIQILMPALSPTMEKGNLAKWLKKEGEKVSPGDVIAEIETDKATMEFEAIDEGVLAKILVPEGTSDVPVNQPIAVLAGEGEDVKAAAAGATKGPAKPAAQAKAPEAKPASTPAAPAQTPATQPAPKQQPAPSTDGHGAGRIFASPLARRQKPVLPCARRAPAPRRALRPCRHRPTSRSARCSSRAPTRSSRTTICARSSRAA